MRVFVDAAVVQVISAADEQWIHPFTGLQPRQFRKVVRLVAAYWRTNLTMRQIGPLFGISHSAAHRVIDTLGPLLALAPVRRRPVEQVTIVDPAGRDRREHPPRGRLGRPQPGNRNDTLVYRTSGINQKLAGRK